MRTQGCLEELWYLLTQAEEDKLGDLAKGGREKIWRVLISESHHRSFYLQERNQEI